MAASAPTTSWGWPEEIGRSLVARRRLHALEGDLSPFSWPGAGASPAALAAAETRLGSPLDRLHRELLAHADGWPEFFTSMHLFSVGEVGADAPTTLAGGARALVEVTFRDGPAIAGLPALDDLLPIAADPARVADVLAVWRVGRSALPATRTAGYVRVAHRRGQRSPVVYQLTAAYAHPADPDAFLEHYTNTHAPLAATFPDLRSYTWNVCETPDGSKPDHFVVAVLTWDSKEQAMASLGSDAGKAGVADLENFAQAGVAMEFGEVRTAL